MEKHECRGSWNKTRRALHKLGVSDAVGVGVGGPSRVNRRGEAVGGVPENSSPLMAPPIMTIVREKYKT